MDLSIVIPTWNSEKQIGACLTSVFAYADDLEIEVFVIDNASKDKTRQMVLGANVPVNLIANETNRGFAGAVNQGIQASQGEYILVLNPDTAVQPHALSIMVRRLQELPAVGVAGGKVLNHDGSLQPSVRRLPTLRDQAVILLKLHRFFPKLIEQYLYTDFDYAIEQDAPQVRGAYFFVSRAAVEKVGLFDEKSFFIWFEEVDFCKRVTEAGMRVLYVPTSEVAHEGGASFAQALSLQKQGWFNASMRNYFKKHGSWYAYLVLVLLSPVSLLLALLVSLVKPKKKYV